MGKSLTPWREVLITVLFWGCLKWREKEKATNTIKEGRRGQDQYFQLPPRPEALLTHYWIVVRKMTGCADSGH